MKVENHGGMRLVAAEIIEVCVTQLCRYEACAASALKSSALAAQASGGIAFSLAPPANVQSCDLNSKGACIQPCSQGDVDCGEIKDRNLRSVGRDPHWLDGDKDGIACENR